MRHSLVDRYRHGTSLVHRLDPRFKLLATLGYVLAVASTPPGNWLALALLGLLALAAILLSRIPLPEALKRSTIALPFAGMVALSLPFTQAGVPLWTWEPLGLHLAITDQGLVLFASVVIKAWLSVLVSGLLVATTTLPTLLEAMRSLRVPAILVTTISFMVRYLALLVDEALRLQTAREARSAGRGRGVAWRARVLGGMVGSLFIRSYERSERIYDAMLARGYGGEIRSLNAPSWQARDTWAGLAWAAALLGAVLAAM